MPQPDQVRTVLQLLIEPPRPIERPQGFALETGFQQEEGQTMEGERGQGDGPHGVPVRKAMPSQFWPDGLT